MEPAEVSRSRGYYCHKCNATISLPPSRYSCPHCNDGFIEKLPDGPSGASSFNERNSDFRDDTNQIPMVFNRVLNDLNNFEVIVHGGESNQGSANGNRPSSSNRHEISSDSTRSNDRRRGRSQTYTGTFEHILNELLNTIRPNTENADNNSPVFFVSNYGDYAWGREGLDTIVTQLLNQMDSSGPPPLAKDKIKELPFVIITEKHVSENIQCSVCWDSFKMAENVRQLPCEHIYHDLCIVPWLELHGTCPICRKVLCEDGDARLGFSHAGGFEALLSDVHHRYAILQNSSTSDVNRTNRRSSIQCYRCYNYGHIARHCPLYFQDTSPVYYDPRFGIASTLESENDIDDVSEGSYSESDYYDSESLHESCDVCGQSTQCPHKNNVEDNNTVSYSGGGSNSANHGYNRTTTDRAYFRKRENTVRCYNCCQLGHIARDCSNTRCTNCDANNCCYNSDGVKYSYHNVYNRNKSSRRTRDAQPKERCAHCNKMNHKSSDCWFAPQGSANRNRYVNNNRNSGSSGKNRFRRNKDNLSYNRSNANFSGPSTSRYQPHGYDDRSNVLCYNCHHTGHIARECAYMGPIRYDRVCTRCGKPGHNEIECSTHYFW